MKLIDTSAWVDYLRGADTRATEEVRRLVGRSDRHQLVMCEPVAMEILAGARDDQALARLEALVNGLRTLSVDPALDFRAAATIFRTARRSGHTVRSLNDCLIAAIAIRHQATLVHKDADFDAIGEATPLRTLSLR